MASAQISAPINTTVTEIPGLNIITTDRLVLRPLLPTDRDAIYAIGSNPRVARCLTHIKPQTRSEYDEWLKQIMESEKCLSHCVELGVSRQPEGETKEISEQKITQNEANTSNNVEEKQGQKSKVIGLMGVHHVPEIGYMFLPDYWGMGYATEALKAWMAWYWRAYPEGREGFGYLKAVTGPGAVGSHNVLRKCGFTCRYGIQHELERYGEEEEEGKEEEEEEGDEGNKYVMLDVWKFERPH